MTDAVQHDHTYPSAGVIIDALRCHQAGSQHNADLIIAPWTCCPTGVTKLIAAHLMLARALGEHYALVVLVLRAQALTFPDDMPQDARDAWAKAHAVVDDVLADATPAAAAALVGFIEERPDEHGPMLMHVAVRVLAGLLDHQPGMSTATATLP